MVNLAEIVNVYEKCKLFLIFCYENLNGFLGLIRQMRSRCRPFNPSKYFRMSTPVTFKYALTAHLLNVKRKFCMVHTSCQCALRIGGFF